MGGVSGEDLIAAAASPRATPARKSGLLSTPSSIELINEKSDRIAKVLLKGFKRTYGAKGRENGCTKKVELLDHVEII